MLFVGTSIIHPSTEGVFLLCNILDLLIYRYENKFKAYYTYEKGKNYTFLPIKIENVDLYKNQIKIW